VLVPFFAWGVYVLRLRYRYHEDISPYVEGATLAGLIVWYLFQFQLLNVWLKGDPILYFFAALGLIVSGMALYGPMLVSLLAQLTVDLIFPKDRYVTNEPRYGPAEALERAGDYQAAAEEYMVIARMFPKDPTTAIRLGDNLMKLDRPADAVGWFERGASMVEAPDKALRIVNRLTEIYLRRLDQPEDALRVLREYLGKFPDAEHAATVGERLSRLENNRPKVAVQ
jgi:tetratricopeptide (TPR) repeat protein